MLSERYFYQKGFSVKYKSFFNEEIIILIYKFLWMLKIKK